MQHYWPDGQMDQPVRFMLTEWIAIDSVAWYSPPDLQNSHDGSQRTDGCQVSFEHRDILLPSRLQ